MNALGKHLLLEMKGCDQKILNDLSYLKDTLLRSASECGMMVLGEYFHQFEPQGVTGVVIIAESHLFIHTWPEYGYAAFDIFTCGDSVQPERVTQLLVRELKAKNHSILEIHRGILDTE